MIVDRTPEDTAAELSALLASLPDDQKLDTHSGRRVMCGDCGVSTSIFDRCEFCGGHAIPLLTR